MSAIKLKGPRALKHYLNVMYLKNCRFKDGGFPIQKFLQKISVKRDISENSERTIIT